jgi:hypothetical protein
MDYHLNLFWCFKEWVILSIMVYIFLPSFLMSEWLIKWLSWMIYNVMTEANLLLFLMLCFIFLYFLCSDLICLLLLFIEIVCRSSFLIHINSLADLLIRKWLWRSSFISICVILTIMWNRCLLRRSALHSILILILSFPILIILGILVMIVCWYIAWGVADGWVPKLLDISEVGGGWSRLFITSWHS